MGTTGEGGVECPEGITGGNASYAGVGATSSLPLGAGNAACFPGHRTDDFLDALNDWRDELKDLDAEARECREDAEAQKDIIDEAEETIEDAEETIEDAEEEIANCEDQLADIEAELDALYDAIDLLFTLEDICPVIVSMLQEEYNEDVATVFQLQTQLGFVFNPPGTEPDSAGTGGSVNNDPQADSLFSTAYDVLEEADSIWMVAAPRVSTA